MVTKLDSTADATQCCPDPSRCVVTVCWHGSSAVARPVVSRFVCVGCEREGQFSRLFRTRRAASIHVGMSHTCRKLGLGVREISVGAETGADVMAGGAGAAGPATDLRHQPPGISHSKKKDIPETKYCFRDILRYPKKTSPKSTYPRISQTFL